MNIITNNIRVNSNNCWVWQKSCSSSGYGQFTKDRVYWNTHRYVWQMLNGDIPADKLIRHICHNKACCNPEHLLIGTHKNNYDDSKDTHIKAAKKQRCLWEVNGIKYETLRDVVKKTGLTMSSVIKFTDKVTRIFNTEAYRKACKIANCIPKV